MATRQTSAGPPRGRKRRRGPPTVEERYEKFLEEAEAADRARAGQDEWEVPEEMSERISQFMQANIGKGIWHDKVCSPLAAPLSSVIVFAPDSALALEDKSAPQFDPHQTGSSVDNHDLGSSLLSDIPTAKSFGDSSFAVAGAVAAASPGFNSETDSGVIGDYTRRDPGQGGEAAAEEGQAAEDALAVVVVDNDEAPGVGNTEVLEINEDGRSANEAHPNQSPSPKEDSVLSPEAVIQETALRLQQPSLSQRAQQIVALQQLDPLSQTQRLEQQLKQQEREMTYAHEEQSVFASTFNTTITPKPVATLSETVVTGFSDAGASFFPFSEHAHHTVRTIQLPVRKRHRRKVFAVLSVQKLFRGHYVRAHGEGEILYVRRESAIRIQHKYKRRHYHRVQMTKRIQAHYRGYRTRLATGGALAYRRAVKLLLRVARGMLGRSEARRRRIRLHAAYMIQRNYRGYVVRNKRYQIVMAMHERLSKYVLEVQRRYRGVLGRIKAKRVRLQTIQDEHDRHEEEQEMVGEAVELASDRCEIYFQSDAGKIEYELELEKIKDEEKEMKRKKLTEAEQAEYRAKILFEIFDTDGSGDIDGDELAVLLKEMCVPSTPEEVQDVLAEIDLDGSGEVDFEEFVAWYAGSDKAPKTAKAMAARQFLLMRSKVLEATGWYTSQRAKAAVVRRRAALAAGDARTHFRKQNAPRFGCCVCGEAFALWRPYLAHFDHFGNCPTRAVRGFFHWDYYIMDKWQWQKRLSFEVKRHLDEQRAVDLAVHKAAIEDLAQLKKTDGRNAHMEVEKAMRHDMREKLHLYEMDMHRLLETTVEVTARAINPLDDDDLVVPRVFMLLRVWPRAKLPSVWTNAPPTARVSTDDVERWVQKVVVRQYPRVFKPDPTIKPQKQAKYFEQFVKEFTRELAPVQADVWRRVRLTARSTHEGLLEFRENRPTKLRSRDMHHLRSVHLVFLRRDYESVIITNFGCYKRIESLIAALLATYRHYQASKGGVFSAVKFGGLFKKKGAVEGEEKKQEDGEEGAAEEKEGEGEGEEEKDPETLEAERKAREDAEFEASMAAMAAKAAEENQLLMEMSVQQNIRDLQRRLGTPLGKEQLSLEAIRLRAKKLLYSEEATQQRKVEEEREAAKARGEKLADERTKAKPVDSDPPPHANMEDLTRRQFVRYYFDLFDVDGMGYVDAEEMVHLCRKLHLRVNSNADVEDKIPGMKRDTAAASNTAAATASSRVMFDGFLDWYNTEGVEMQVGWKKALDKMRLGDREKRDAYDMLICRARCLGRAQFWADGANAGKSGNAAIAAIAQQRKARLSESEAAAETEILIRVKTKAAEAEHAKHLKTPSGKKQLRYELERVQRAMQWFTLATRGKPKAERQEIELMLLLLLFDTDASGAFDDSELPRLLRTFGINMSEAQYMATFACMRDAAYEVDIKLLSEWMVARASRTVARKVSFAYYRNMLGAMQGSISKRIFSSKARQDATEQLMESIEKDQAASGGGGGVAVQGPMRTEILEAEEDSELPSAMVNYRSTFEAEIWAFLLTFRGQLVHDTLQRDIFLAQTRIETVCDKRSDEAAIRLVFVTHAVSSKGIHLQAEMLFVAAHLRALGWRVRPSDLPVAVTTPSSYWVPGGIFWSLDRFRTWVTETLPPRNIFVRYTHSFDPSTAAVHSLFAHARYDAYVYIRKEMDATCLSSSTLYRWLALEEEKDFVENFEEFRNSKEIRDEMPTLRKQNPLEAEGLATMLDVSEDELERDDVFQLMRIYMGDKQVLRDLHTLGALAPNPITTLLQKTISPKDFEQRVVPVIEHHQTFATLFRPRSVLVRKMLRVRRSNIARKESIEKMADAIAAIPPPMPGKGLSMHGHSLHAVHR